jgi:hypothetical protein
MTRDRFGAEERRAVKSAKRKGGLVLENKQSREMRDSVLKMISMTYDEPSERSSRFCGLCVSPAPETNRTWLRSGRVLMNANAAYLEGR